MVRLFQPSLIFADNYQAVALLTNERLVRQGGRVSFLASWSMASLKSFIRSGTAIYDTIF
jgi:hypothetical protein